MIMSWTHLPGRIKAITCMRQTARFDSTKVQSFWKIQAKWFAVTSHWDRGMGPHLCFSLTQKEWKKSCVILTKRTQHIWHSPMPKKWRRCPTGLDCSKLLYTKLPKALLFCRWWQFWTPFLKTFPANRTVKRPAELLFSEQQHRRQLCCHCFSRPFLWLTLAESAGRSSCGSRYWMGQNCFRWLFLLRVTLCERQC